MPRSSSPLDVGKRERQIVEAVYRLGEASVAQVRAEVSNPPSYSAVRAILTTLVGKKVLAFRQEGKRYLYRADLAGIGRPVRIATASVHVLRRSADACRRGAVGRLRRLAHPRRTRSHESAHRTGAKLDSTIFDAPLPFGTPFLNNLRLTGDVTAHDAKERNADHQRPQAELEAAAGWTGIGGHVAIIDSTQIGPISGSGRTVRWCLLAERFCHRR